MTELELKIIRKHSLVSKDDYFKRYYELYAKYGNQYDAYMALNDEFEKMYGFRKHMSLAAFKSEFQRYNADRGTANRVGKPKKI